MFFIKNLIFPKPRLFFNSLIGKFDFVIKVGQIISFSHVGAHFQAKSTMQTHGPTFFQVLSDFPSLRSENPQKSYIDYFN